MQKMIDAMTLATAAHGSQRYGRAPNDVPYTFHLAAVVGALLRVGETDPDRLAGGWLHDTLEDTKLLRSDVERMTNERIANVVLLVSNPPGANRAERHLLMRERLYLWPNEGERLDAVTVKLADRVANVEASILTGNSLLRMYEKEQTGFDQMVEKVIGRDPSGDPRAVSAFRLRLLLDRLITTRRIER